MKIRVGVFFGGKTVEHEVSVISAMQAIAALDRSKYEVIPVYITKDNAFFTGGHLGDIAVWRDVPDALRRAQQVLPAGTGVEDGALQGFLEYLGVPYAGCGVAASAAGMDKWMMKCLFRAAGVPVAEGQRIAAPQFYAAPASVAHEAFESLGGDVIVKPVNLGSSVGVGRARTAGELERKIADALLYSPAVLCERTVQNLREINCAVLGDRDGVRTSVCEEPLGAGDFLSYADKYQSGGKGAKGAKQPAGGTKSGAGMQSLSRRVPAELPEALAARARELAAQAFLAIDASGCSRVDLMLDDKTGELLVNEINTIPGSLAFYLWEASGLSFSALLDELVALALKRSREQSSLTSSFDTNLLATAGLGTKK